ncbi:tRNA-uridine aminocarboxypropyltransferase [Veronia pacifica]|uniref:tRNA-uridine aminocarboxypropyltransferase n=1 Tax=Veronia pacifica TaxID=1080227 RepID=UPI001112FE21|nr:DTW domain-containing protein [Veronia pacifica]
MRRLPKLDSHMCIDLLMHETESDKRTNTGKLLLASFPYCRQHVWQRTSPPDELVARIADPDIDSWLLFPGDHSIPASQCQQAHKAEVPQHFIIIDATWQQARKMLRKSPWLSAVNTLHIQPDSPSRYALRRNQKDGHLCTCEVGISLLEEMGDNQNARVLSQYFLKFIETFEADRQHKSLSSIQV